ncbi:lipid droplet-associated protein [Actinophytocola oryzae]|uniref:DUF8129 domain-containing protein n=1 Tax=Actinophytocola oryzae TaxID=502181 RepID=A0A4R7VD98_9PSEU|nr:lipid droplet-associated protein [Actinophytocola oryzae]TDV47116.1 hypothetical protein CLV71_110300 [Actinophytocola oryzae]
MKSLPLPIRVAAGLAVTAVEQARTLPAKLAGLPVTVASQALQVSMRVQQQVTELAIRGDEVLAGLRPVEDTPEWATFDEDAQDDGFDVSRPAPFESAFDRVEDEPDRRNGHHTDSPETFATPDPWTQEERALAEEADAHDGLGGLEDVDEDPVEPPVPADDPRSLPEAAGYDELSLPQLRARLRRFSADELAELLEYERAHGNRPSFVGMLTRRIATVRDQR